MKRTFGFCLVVLALFATPLHADELTADETRFIYKAFVFALSNFSTPEVRRCLARTAKRQPLSEFGVKFYGNRDGRLIANQLNLWDRERARRALPKMDGEAYYTEDFSFARAPLDVVKATFNGFEGTFKVKFNRYQLNQNRDVAVWGGVIAHELLHNLSHVHPNADDVGLDTAYSDELVINAFQNCVTTRGKYEGSNIAPKARCGGR